jgi:DNA-directed RNA polymerase subunit RPC12/RpoP
MTIIFSRIGKQMEETIQEYIVRSFEKAFIDTNWLKGYLCLRCHPKGLLTDDRPDGTTWCPYCGKDPLMHGPEIPVKPIKEKLKMRGSRATAMWVDEIYRMDI